MTQLEINQSSVDIGEDSLTSNILLASQATFSTETPLISTHLREIVDIVNYVTISAAIGVFGIFSNVINITVFVRQGFHDVITISLLALAVSDLLALIAMEIYDIFINPFVRSADLPFIPTEIQYIMASWPHSCFTRITCLLTAFVTLERCLCITFPLKIKTILSPMRASVAVISIFLCVFISVIPAYLTVELRWRFDPEKNRTVLGVDEKKDVKEIADIAFVVNCIMQFIAFGSVIVSTVILVAKLKYRSKWRNATSSSGKGDNKTSSISPKDMKLIRMVILISVILILCCTPGSSFFITALFVKEFSPNGVYRNLHSVAWSFAFITDAINPSVSIFIYYSMSSKYRVTFRRLFPVCFKGRHDALADDSSAPYTVNNKSSKTTKKTQLDSMPSNF